MQVQWAKRADGGWYSLDSFDADRSLLDGQKGVFVVFRGGLVIAVGGGVLAEGLQRQRKALQPRLAPDLEVTWAAVEEKRIEGIEKFLQEQLSPLAGSRIVNCRSTSVNLPV
jgi:hypothetical protein